MSKPKQEDVFQAVLLADNFCDSIFGEDSPIELEGLIPLANRRLIDYSLEALTVSGVQEIFLFVSNNADALEEYLRTSKWMELPIIITVITSEGCLSLGDALRNLDARGMIRNDFVLMTAGALTNKPIRPWLDLHRETVKADKGAVMTLIHRKIPPGHRSRENGFNSAFVVDSATGKIITYTDKVKGKKLNIPLESIQNEMEIFVDSCDTGIAICSASVLPLFTDNFDFGTIPEFIKGILMNEEIMGNTIYLHRVEKGYANKVVDYDTYYGISCDIMQRWTFPVVPDLPFGCSPDEVVYNMNFNFVYKALSVKCAREANIGPSVIIGAETTVGEGTSISCSSIGHNCIIHPNVKITDCQIGNNVEIMEGVVLSHCLVLDGSRISKDPEIKPRSLVSKDKIYCIPEKSLLDDSIDSDSDSDGEGLVGNEGITDASDDGEEGGHQEKDFKRFCTEIVESLARGFTDNVQTENLALEIHGSRTANFMYFEDVTPAVIQGIVVLATKIHPDFKSMPLKMKWEKTKEVIVKFRDLMQNYVKDVKAQHNMLKALEEYASDNEYFRSMLTQVLHYYYDEDLLSEEVIIKWFHTKSLYEGADDIRNSVKKFVEWLEAASEESESDDD